MVTFFRLRFWSLRHCTNHLNFWMIRRRRTRLRNSCRYGLNCRKNKNLNSCSWSNCLNFLMKNRMSNPGLRMTCTTRMICNCLKNFFCCFLRNNFRMTIRLNFCYCLQVLSTWSMMTMSGWNRRMTLRMKNLLRSQTMSRWPLKRFPRMT